MRSKEEEKMRKLIEIIRASKPYKTIRRIGAAALLVYSLNSVLDNKAQAQIIEDDTEDSYSCTGDLEQLISPCSNAVDEDWSTKVAWDTTSTGHYGVDIVEGFEIPDSVNRATWQFSAYHMNNGASIIGMPDPSAIYVTELGYEYEIREEYDSKSALSNSRSV